MTKSTWRIVVGVPVAAAVLALFVLACFPEPPATLLTDVQGWQVTGPASSRVRLGAFPEVVWMLSPIQAALELDGRSLDDPSPRTAIS